MKRVLLTGMSGVGKSSVIEQLKARGHWAFDLDDPEWSVWADCAGDEGPSPLQPGKDWVWREDRVSALLARNDADVLFVSGCASNQGKFHDRFDSILLLSAPATVMVQRLASRGAGSYGGQPEEIARSLHFKRTIEPKLRCIATGEVDTTAPLKDVIGVVLDLVLRGVGEDPQR